MLEPSPEIGAALERLTATTCQHFAKSPIGRWPQSSRGLDLPEAIV